MTYQVTARRWRPQVFDEVVGQEHVIRTLKNAIEQNRLAQAYLFSGTRGVGKTTTARILAKSLNCAEGVSVSPCDKCDRCVEIVEGNSMDVIEIDGASNNSVDDIRELRENVKYAPAKSRFKIYIIDEVHMLSKSAFNALLKTLEEPPNHVKFIFATTEEDKIPETVSSRCQCFEFRHISFKDIIFQLKKITESDGITIEEESLALIAKTAEGSLRDAESILDQMISFSGKEIKTDDIVSILGLVGFDKIAAFMDKIFEKKPTPLLELFQDLVFQGQDFRLFLKELMEYVRNLIVLKVSKESKNLISLSSEEMDRLKGQLKKVSIDELHQIFKIISDVELGVKRTSYPVMLVEMALIRLTEIRPFQSIDNIIESLSQIGTEIERDGIGSASKIKEETPHYDNVKTDDSFNDTEKIWGKIKNKTKEKKNHLGMFLDSGELVSITDNDVEIGFSDRFTLGRMQKDENKKILLTAVEEVLNKKIRLLLKETTGRNEKEEDKKGKKSTNQEQTAGVDKEIVQDALNIFGGEVIGEKQ